MSLYLSGLQDCSSDKEALFLLLCLGVCGVQVVQVSWLSLVEFGLWCETVLFPVLVLPCFPVFCGLF